MKKTQIVSVVAAAGLVAGCSSMGNRSAQNSLTIDQLPPAAQTTVRNEAGNQTVYSIKEANTDGQVAYKVELSRHGFYPFHPTLVVSQDGSVLKESRWLADRNNKINEAAGAQNGTVSAPSGSTQAPSEANPAGTNPNKAEPTTSGQ